MQTQICEEAIVNGFHCFYWGGVLEYKYFQQQSFVFQLGVH